MSATQPMTIGYLRVSTADQDIEKNKTDLLHLANDHDLGKVHFMAETVSGRVAWRKRKIAEILDQAQPGDNILISKLSRLGRSMLECMEILSIALSRRINIYAVKGSWRLDRVFRARLSLWPSPWRRRSSTI